MNAQYDPYEDPARVQFPFGKYKGEPVNQVPSGYLIWCLEECDNLRPWLRRMVQRVLVARIGCQPVAPRPMLALPDDAVLDAAHTLIGAGYRAAAKRLHPDAGGDHVAMVQLSAARDWLTGVLEGVA